MPCVSNGFLLLLVRPLLLVAMPFAPSSDVFHGGVLHGGELKKGGNFFVKFTGPWLGCTVWSKIG